jgi:hypothetical protein
VDRPVPDQRSPSDRSPSDTTVGLGSVDISSRRPRQDERAADDVRGQFTLVFEGTFTTRRDGFADSARIGIQVAFRRAGDKRYCAQVSGDLSCKALEGSPLNASGEIKLQLKRAMPPSIEEISLQLDAGPYALQVRARPNMLDLLKFRVRFHGHVRQGERLIGDVELEISRLDVFRAGWSQLLGAMRGQP